MRRKDKNDKHEIWKWADTGINMHLDNGELVARHHLDAAGIGAEYTPLNPDGTPKLDKDGNPIKIGFGYDTSKEFKGSKRTDDIYTLITRNGTKPIVQGAGYLAIPDSLAPGWRYKRFDEEGTGELIYDADYQQKIEKMVKTPSNGYGGSMA